MPVAPEEFVIHEHLADRAGLHYDLRLQEGNDLISWAVPKGVPTEPRVRRLAIKVADHRVGYLRFEGRIEEGYGKGDVKIFDIGDYDIIHGSVPGGDIIVQLRGDKVRGNYHLRHTKGNKWLIWRD